MLPAEAAHILAAGLLGLLLGLGTPGRPGSIEAQEAKAGSTGCCWHQASADSSEEHSAAVEGRGVAGGAAGARTDQAGRQRLPVQVGVTVS